MQSHLQKLPRMAANLRRDDDDKRRETTRDDERRRREASHANTAPTPRPPTINGNPSLRIREKYIHTYIHTSIHPYTHTSIHPYIHTSTHTSIHPYVHTCIRAYTHTRIHAYMHTRIHAYIHTCIHAYIHTYIKTSHNSSRSHTKPGTGRFSHWSLASRSSRALELPLPVIKERKTFGISITRTT